MAKQLSFDLPLRTALGRDDFIVSECNREAVDLLDQWPNWPGVAVCLVGPARSGKSHLLEVWREMSGAVLFEAACLSEETVCELRDAKAVALDDVEQLNDETALFHLFNILKENEGHLLMTSPLSPSAFSIALPDLKSRLMTSLVASLEAPDDELLQGLFQKLFHDRQMRVANEVIQYLVTRTERTFEAVSGLVATLDGKALDEHRRITIPLARSVLDDEATQDE